MALLQTQPKGEWFFIDFEEDGAVYEVEVEVVGSVDFLSQAEMMPALPACCQLGKMKTKNTCSVTEHSFSLWITWLITGLPLVDSWGSTLLLLARAVESPLSRQSWSLICPRGVDGAVSHDECSVAAAVCAPAGGGIGQLTRGSVLSNVSLGLWLTRGPYVRQLLRKRMEAPGLRSRLR